MITLPNMNIVLPTRGASGSGLWGDTVDADLALIDAHDHTTGRGARIVSAGININADLPFSALWAPTQLHRVQFSAIASGGLTAGQRKSLFVSDGTGGTVANELYYFTSAGATIQITTGSALNVGAFVGGIGGDYAGVGATLNYTDAAKGYEFKESTADSHGWARLRAGDLRLLPFNTTSAFFVAQAADPALATSYTMTWPTALPGVNGTLMQLNTAGTISFANTGLAAASFTGLITASAGVTAGANQHVTVSGTGEYKHGTLTLQIGHTLWTNTGGTALTFVGGTSIVAAGMTMLIECAIPLKVGDRITAIRFTGSDSSTGPTKFQGGFGPYLGAAAGNTAVSAGTGNVQTLPITAGLPVTIGAAAPYWMNFFTTTGTNNTQFRFVEIDYDRP